ncbi:DUF6950 family protein [Sphingomonas sanguinis]|uniref:DUF6950 family protein n=1 Tax=Sphingomonas sanguinis TaxID=33051 RepID=UPI0009E6C1FB
MEAIVRYPDWEDRLRTYLDRVEYDPFVWGQHDCALFAASCVRAQTGVDPAVAYRGTYDTANGARTALRELGAGTLLKTVKSWFGEPKSVHFAQRGDIVMRDATTVGVCVGQFSFFVGEEQGVDRLAIIPTRDCRYAFTVPFELPVVSGE